MLYSCFLLPTKVTVVALGSVFITGFKGRLLLMRCFICRPGYQISYNVEKTCCIGKFFLNCQ